MATLLVFLIAAQNMAVQLVGQSLCNGPGTTAFSTSQTASNSFLTGNTYNSTTGFMDSPGSPWPLAALVESSLESPRHGFARGFYATSGQSVIVMSNCVGGYSYAQMAPGTEAWTNLNRLMESLGARTNKPVVAAVAIHGEQDHVLGTTQATYAANLSTWQANIQSKVRLSTKTGSGASVPLVVKQVSSWTKYGQATSLIPLAQYDAMKANGSIVIATPDYASFPYLSPDGVHHTSIGSCALGYKLGVVTATLMDNSAWRPLYPTSIARTGAKIVLTFNVPTGPLELDTTLVSNPGSYGFSYTDDSSPPAISAVELCSGSVDPLCVNSNQVLITLASTPTGANKKIRYAYSGTPGAEGGSSTSARGNLRDSDATSVTCNGTTVPLYNWAVHFEETLS